MHLKEIFISFLLLSADYIAEMCEMTESVQETLQRKAPYPVHSVVVIDIDETALTNGDFIEAWPGVSSNGPEWQRYYEEHPAKPNLPILHLTEWLEEQGIGVIFLSGRREALRAMTVRQLEQAGYKNWLELYLKPACEESVAFKHKILQEIAARGVVVLAHLSDRAADLEETIALSNFLVPNPFY